MIRLTALLALLGYTAGLHWIYISLHTYGEMPSWLAALATLLLSAYVALYAVGAAAACQWLSLSFRDRLTPVAIASVVTLLEWLRGHLFTGFPWLGLGYLAIDTPLSGFAPVIGVYGVGFMVVLCVGWAVQAITHRHWLAFGALVTSLALGFGSGLYPFTQPEGRPLRVALVQGAIPQSMKFDPARESEAIATQFELARTAAVPGGPALIVFPETALVRPWDLTSPTTQALFHRLAQPAEATVMLGVPLRNSNGWFNSLIAIDAATPEGQFRAHYDKHHLVPFGEFIPWGFRWFVDMMNMPLGDFSRGPAVQSPIAVRDQRIGVNICFEDLFGEEIIRPFGHPTAAAPPPTILLNVSNLAWFGQTIALDQHLAIARMRSKETGRPSIRATNTGATVAIDHQGVVTDALAHGEPGLLLAQVQGMQGTTPYARWGNLPILGVSLAGLALALMGARRRRRAR